ncbi:MAG: AmmeMemoRadiSam system protein A [Spirochaetaceae bacterium]|jgi:AmmeMemoRadiSam system protein A|nr:AmmeMemoRadiSam system protein A [Spirochaetaceae bacterium]
MEFVLTAEEKSTLLADARETIAARLENRSPRYHRGPEFTTAAASGASVLTKPCGAFVTIHKSAGEAGKPGGTRRLRGCIGRMIGTESLEKTVRTMALEAAFGDPRFPPLSAEELPRCDIEISVLSPMEKCPDPRQVKVGLHGLYLIYRGRSGVLLPQVPVEQGWNLDEYLDYICVKAGVPSGSCEAPGAELHTFTAVVFGEFPQAGSV